ncbi:MAG: peptidylprolyl isomerase [Sphingomonadaceae bacterium]|nr:peptidylprolyl isomerase [Sphingomonadaceae bacterium]
MKRLLALPVGAFALIAAQAPETPPVAPAQPHEIVAASRLADWRPIAPENLLVMTLGSGAIVMIELAPDFAPEHVENIRRLARANWWDGTSINRVQDNYVVQWGDASEAKPLPADVVATPAAEYAFAAGGFAPAEFSEVQQGHYTATSGWLRGWPAGFDRDASGGLGEGSLVHCYGMVGVGRGDNPDPGTGAELYTVIGHAPRHLDRNIALVGRVVEGMPALSSLPRGTGDLGFYETPEERIAIASIRFASELPEAERPRFEVMRTDTEAFRRYIDARSNRSGWFVRPAGAVDVCNVNLPIRRVSD